MIVDGVKVDRVIVDKAIVVKEIIDRDYYLGNTHPRFTIANQH